MLRAHAERAGLSPNFTIIDTDDQLRLMKQILTAEGIDDKKWPARAVLAAVERWKDRGLGPAKVSAGEAGDLAGGRAVELYAIYQERLRILNACDFGDLLLHTFNLFQDVPEVLERYHRAFRYILVDEYQDTNVLQYLWLRLLAQGHRNICCVGDDDQSIYGWRGAEVGNILRFEADFPGARVIRLERNYRSTGHILAVASGLIAHNEGRLGKTLWTEDDAGEAVRVRGLWDGEAEARFVGDEIEALQRSGHKLSEIAILVRTTAQMREFEDRFITLGLPYRVVGGPRFYERQEIRDALAYLRLIHQPDDGLAFERIANKPRRGLGDKSLQILHVHARARSISLTRAARELIQTEELRPAARRALAGFLDSLDRWRAAAEDLHHCELAELVLDESGYTEMWQDSKTVDAPGRLDNLKELVVALDKFETLGGFLEHVSLVMESVEDRGADRASLMTLHGAKGLEFDTVFLPGWEEGLFPNQRALDESGLRALEEERRLAYVGLTRARLRAIVSFAANRRLHGSWAAAIPSRFVEELGADAVERISEPGLYGGGAEDPQAGGGFAEWSEDRYTPGMARARARAGRTERFIDVVPTLVESLPSNALRAGTRIFHAKFGYGTVRKVDGERLTIGFDKAGEKKVMSSFVVPEDQAG
jgi:DNA helicase-2/ATP-dependent DNA helicase PcrA